MLQKLHHKHLPTLFTIIFFLSAECFHGGYFTKNVNLWKQWEFLENVAVIFFKLKISVLNLGVVNPFPFLWML